MNISNACTPPEPAPLLARDHDHPKFKDYLKYRSAMTCQMVYCQPFSGWLSSVEYEEKRERGELPFQIIDRHPDAADIWSHIRHQISIGSKKTALELFYEWIELND